MSPRGFCESSCERIRFSESQGFSDGFAVSFSPKSSSSDTAPQESHQPASPASRRRERLHSYRYRTTRSPLARALLPGGAKPRGRQRAAAWSLPYSALVLSADRSSRQLRWQQGFRSLTPEARGLEDFSCLAGLPCDSFPNGLRCLLFWNCTPCASYDRYCRAMATFSRSSAVMK